MMDYMTAPVLSVMTKTHIVDLFPEKIEENLVTFCWTEFPTVCQYAILFHWNGDYRVIKMYAGKVFQSQQKLRLGLSGMVPIPTESQ